MAIYHCSMKSFSRSDGKSATGAAAYRAGMKITDERTGVVHNYSRKRGVEKVVVMKPHWAPAWVDDPAKLWNHAEQVEGRKNSVVAREFEIALPCELDAGQRLALAEDIGQRLVQRFGFVLQVALHKPGKGEKNFHAHMLATTRRMGREGLEEKTRELDSIRDTSALQFVREMVAERTNLHLEMAASEARVDHRSLADQQAAALESGDLVKAFILSREPTQKIGREPERSAKVVEANAKIRSQNGERYGRIREKIRRAAGAYRDARVIFSRSNANTAGVSAIDRERVERDEEGLKMLLDAIANFPALGAKR